MSKFIYAVLPERVHVALNVSFLISVYSVY